MKACSKCKITDLPLSMFSVNDYGRPYSYCKECQNRLALERYRKKKEESEKLKSQEETSFLQDSKVG